MIKVAMAGAAGKMGKVISRIIIEECDDMRITGSFEAGGNPLLGSDAGKVSGVEEIGIEITDVPSEAISGAGVLIDFTASEASVSNVMEASGLGVATVIGSTGFTRSQREEVEKCSSKVPVVLAPNMSVGINLLFKIVKDIADVLGPDFDVEISEIHHRLKKDAPSGTAVRLGEILADALGMDLEESGVYGRKGIIGERGREEIGIMTLRAGDIVGEHTVIFGGIGERVEITHRAHTRETFARGAIRAARWIQGKSPGMYDMQDVLGLK